MICLVLGSISRPYRSRMGMVIVLPQVGHCPSWAAIDSVASSRLEQYPQLNPYRRPAPRRRGGAPPAFPPPPRPPPPAPPPAPGRPAGPPAVRPPVPAAVRPAGVGRPAVGRRRVLLLPVGPAGRGGRRARRHGVQGRR